MNLLKVILLVAALFSFTSCSHFYGNKGACCKDKKSCELKKKCCKDK